MPELDDPLAKDANNVEATTQWLRDFDPALPEALDAAMNLFITIDRAFGQDASFQASQQIISEGVRALGATDWDDLTRILEHPDDLPSEETRAIAASLEAARDETWSAYIREILLAQAARSYGWAATDLLRTRITVSWGHLRVQAEAAALMLLMSEEPSLALRWFRVVRPHEGRRFHEDTTRRVGEVAKRYGLGLIRELGSGASLHPRMAGIAPGLSTRVSTEAGGEVRAFQLRFHEVDPEQPEFFLAQILNLLLTQTRVFNLACTAMPEIQDPLLLQERLPQFGREVGRLWGRFGATYREYVEGLREAAQRRAAQEEALSADATSRDSEARLVEEKR